MSLAARDTELEELMDDPDCDPVRLAATLRRFDTVNRLFAGWGTVYRRHLAPHLASLGRPARVLDIGAGGGDLVLRLADRAGRDGFSVEWTGIDPDPRAHAVAVERGHPANVAFRIAATGDLADEGESFDAVLSNHVLHHLGSGAAGFAEASRDLSRGIVLHGDIARSPYAYGLYAVGITPFAPGTFLRTDGLRSIRRSYTRDELERELDAAAPGAWSIDTHAPFRLLAVGRGRA